MINWIYKILSLRTSEWCACISSYSIKYLSPCIIQHFMNHDMSIHIWRWNSPLTLNTGQHFKHGVCRNAIAHSYLPNPANQDKPRGVQVTETGVEVLRHEVLAAADNRTLWRGRKNLRRRSSLTFDRWPPFIMLAYRYRHDKWRPCIRISIFSFLDPLAF